MTKPVRLTIIGLGRTGLGLGMALKAVAGDQIHIVGHDKDPERTRVASRRKAIDKGDWNLPRSVEEADLVILAIPFSQVRETLTFIAEALRPQAVVTDTAALMTPVLRWAESILPEEVHFIPGHPILRDVIGDDEAVSPDMFRDVIYCVGTTAQAHPRAVKLVSDMISLIAARPLFLQPEEHDALIAGVEQTPQVMALVLLHALTRSPGWKDLRKLAGAQMEAGTYITVGDAEALVDMLLANGEHLFPWLEGLEAHVRYWRQLLEEGDRDRVVEHVRTLQEAREAWIRAALEGRWEETPRSGKRFSPWDWLFGESFTRRWRGRREE